MTRDGLPDRTDEKVGAIDTRSWFRWSVARWIAHSRLPQASALIPAIGYALLWSDDFSDLLGSKTRLGESFLSIDGRLQMLWWGAVLMTIGWVIFNSKCPVEIKRAGEPRDYVLEEFSLRNQRRIKYVAARVTQLMKRYSKHETDKIIFGLYSPSQVHKACQDPSVRSDAFGNGETHPTELLLTINYHLIDHRNPGWSKASVIFLITGAVLFLLPSLDVSIRVLSRLIG